MVVVGAAVAVGTVAAITKAATDKVKTAACVVVATITTARTTGHHPSVARPHRKLSRRR
jgi:hypothetical protein